MRGQIPKRRDTWLWLVGVPRWLCAGWAAPHPSIQAEDHRPWSWGQQPHSGGFQREVWSLFLPEPSETKIQSLPFCICPPTTVLLKVWEKWRWEMFSMPPCYKSHWKANGSEPEGEQANENPARNGIHAFFLFFSPSCFWIWQNLEQL